MKFKDIIAEVFLVICILAVILGAYKSCRESISQTTSPVEEMTIDSLTFENNKLIIEVNNLDSIKDVQIIEIKSLDNDSTLKLFYQLISE